MTTAAGATRFVGSLRALAGILAATVGCGLSAQVMHVIDGVGFGLDGYDPVRDRIVHASHQGKTWEWKGNDWFLRPVPTPSFTNWIGSTWDPRRRQILFLVEQSLTTELYGYDGTAWTLIAVPPGQVARGVAYDTGRQRLVLVARDSVGYHTWEDAGAGWVDAGAGPAMVAELAQMSYDGTRGRIMLLDGYRLDFSTFTVWNYDGTAWTQQNQGSPIGFGLDRLAHDPASGQMVLRSAGAGDRVYDGTAWTTTTTSGSAQYYFNLCETPGGLLSIGEGPSVLLRSGSQWFPVGAMSGDLALSSVVADPQRGVLMAKGRSGVWRRSNGRWSHLPFGSIASSPFVFDAARGLMLDLDLEYPPFAEWRWDGTSWSSTPFAGTVPSQRTDYALAYDAARGEVVMFGGFDYTNVLNELWAWNGTTWSGRFSPTGAPSPRRGASMVYDPVQQHVLMMGFSGSGIALDTWRWNGVDWRQLVAVAPFTGASSLAFDPAVARPVTVSRIGTTATLHEFNGVTWQPRLSQVVPVNGLLDPFELVVEPGTGRMLVNAGEHLLQFANHQTAVVEQDAGCYTAPRLGARAVPLLGTTEAGIDCSGVNGPVLLGLGFATGSTPVGGGCTLLLGSIDLEFALLANAGGFASLVLAIPPGAPLGGAIVYAQAGQLDATSPTGFALSRRLALTIGD